MDNFNEIEIIENIDKAILLLKAKKVLVSILNSAKTYFVEKKYMVLVVNTNSTFLLNYDKFKELYKDVKFIIYEEKEENYDFSRDDEYYGWKHK